MADKGGTAVAAESEAERGERTGSAGLSLIIEGELLIGGTVFGLAEPAGTES